MIVDDEPANIDLIRGILPQEIKCKAALNGKVALKQLQKQLPHLLFLDLNMPLLSGHETLVEIRKFADNQQLPVIVVTSDEDMEQLKALSTLGIAGYIVKPIDSDKLLQLASAHIGN